MNTRLANEGKYVSASLTGAALTLQPTLRAGLRLCDEFNSFGELIKKLLDGDYGATLAVLRATAESNSFAASEGNLRELPLNEFMAATSLPVIEVVLALAGVDPAETEPNKPSSGKKISFEEYHTQLYQIATGWLGWTPDVALDATPNQILTAYKGRTAMLKAIFGGANDNEENGSEYDPGELDRQGLSKLKAMARGL